MTGQRCIAIAHPSFGSTSATTDVYRMRRSDPYSCWPWTCWNGPPRAKTHTANAPVEMIVCVTGGRRAGTAACFHVHQAVRRRPMPKAAHRTVWRGTPLGGALDTRPVTATQAPTMSAGMYLTTL